MSPLRLCALIAVVMIAFAANSLLNRMAVDGGHIGALPFALIRVLSGAVMLSAIVLLSRRKPRLPPPVRFVAAGCLSLYLLGFSIAYVHLDAGLGALVLFGGVQLVTFAAAVAGAEVISPRRWIGAGLALAGLAVLGWPGEAAAEAFGLVFMALAAVGWAGYTLLGRGSDDPLSETTACFLIAIPMVWVPLLMLPVSPEGPAPITRTGLALAIISGAVTSGLGYALWYAILPRLAATTAGLVQLLAPLIAVLGGVVILGEAPDWRIGLAATLILGGIAFALSQRRIGSSGS